MNPSLTSEAYSRRQFLKHGLVATGGALIGSPAFGEDKSAPLPESETLVTTLYQSLNEEQRKSLCFAFDHPLRDKVDNNWHIVPQKIGEVLMPDQQAMTREIFDKLHSEEYKEKVWEQFDSDNKSSGGFGSASIALFGEPGTGKFEFVLTGRHCTRRCDGDSLAGTAFGGPIFYGHAAGSFNEKPDHPGNVYWYQAKRANEVFAALDGKQREKALCADAREESGNDTVKLTGKKSGLDGVPMSDLSADQQGLVRQVLSDLLLPFRKNDADEAMKLINKNGFDALSMAFYKNQDVGKDGIWDVWQIEGPAMIWYFRGDPHVHCWAHIKESA